MLALSIIYEYWKVLSVIQSVVFRVQFQIEVISVKFVKDKYDNVSTRTKACVDDMHILHDFQLDNKIFTYYSNTTVSAGGTFVCKMGFNHSNNSFVLQIQFCSYDRTLHISTP